MLQSNSSSDARSNTPTEFQANSRANKSSNTGTYFMADSISNWPAKYCADTCADATSVSRTDGEPLGAVTCSNTSSNT
jgi:hypothetical protein